MLQCAEYGGPYTISGKDYHSCTNRKKRLPIDELDGECCTNGKTITRHELEQLARELATADEPAEDFQGKIEKLKTQFNPANIGIAIRKLIFLARNNADEAAKRRLMPIVRDLIQTVVIGKTPGHQPASLQVHGDIANIMASMDVIDVLQQQFFTAAQNDLMARMASGEIDTEAKKNRLIEAYIDELSRKLPEWENLQVSVVAGARSNLHLRPEQVKMVAGSGYSAGASITPSFLAELAKLIHPVVASPQDGALFAATA